METNSILAAHSVRRTYAQGETKLEVLTGLDLQLKPGETVAILGQSGSGKSTLLSILAGLDFPTEGKVELSGRDITRMDEKELTLYRAKNLGIVFQQFHLMSNLTALENVALPLEIAGDENSLAKATETLGRVGLSARANHFPHQLSGGEKQRIAIARALVVEPPVILADEPSGNLDTKTGEQVMQLLFDLVKSKGTAMVLVTHNEELAKLCSRSLRLTNGKLVPGASA